MLLAGGSLGLFPSAVLGEEGYLNRDVDSAETNVCGQLSTTSLKLEPCDDETSRLMVNRTPTYL